MRTNQKLQSQSHLLRQLFCLIGAYLLSALSACTDSPSTRAVPLNPADYSNVEVRSVTANSATICWEYERKHDLFDGYIELRVRPNGGGEPKQTYTMLGCTVVNELQGGMSYSAELVWVGGGASKSRKLAQVQFVTPLVMGIVGSSEVYEGSSLQLKQEGGKLDAPLVVSWIPKELLPEEQSADAGPPEELPPDWVVEVAIEDGVVDLTVPRIFSSQVDEYVDSRVFVIWATGELFSQRMAEVRAINERPYLSELASSGSSSCDRLDERGRVAERVSTLERTFAGAFIREQACEARFVHSSAEEESTLVIAEATVFDSSCAPRWRKASPRGGAPRLGNTPYHVDSELIVSIPLTELPSLGDFELKLVCVSPAFDRRDAPLELESNSFSLSLPPQHDTDDCVSTCNEGRTCLTYASICNGTLNCFDHSDEQDCPEPTCALICDNGHTCLESRHWLCDGFQDCADGADEAECETDIYPEPTTTDAGAAPPDAASPVCDGFSCDGDECVSDDRICDGYEDCADGSDEADCAVQSSCNTGFWPCGSGECTARESRCNGALECADGSDEANCAQICEPGQFMCPEGVECLSNIVQCDGKDDCAGGSDEWNCIDLCRSNRGFRCEDTRECLRGVRCDNQLDCDDGSDEQNCAQYCEDESGFLCTTGTQCAPELSRCDGFEDCDDGSDELDCEQPLTDGGTD